MLQLRSMPFWIILFIFFENLLIDSAESDKTSWREDSTTTKKFIYKKNISKRPPPQERNVCDRRFLFSNQIELNLEWNKNKSNIRKQKIFINQINRKLWIKIKNNIKISEKFCEYLWFDFASLLKIDRFDKIFVWRKKVKFTKKKYIY